MVSDGEIVRHLTAVLESADLNTTTTKAIRVQLESDLGVDLSEKKKFISEQVDLYLQKQSLQGQEQEGEYGGEEEGAGGRGDGGGGETGAGVEEEGEEEEDGEEDDGEEGDGEEGEGDESESRRTSTSSKVRGEPDSKRMKAKIDRAIKASKEPKEKKKRAGGGGGLTKACALSPELQVIIGESELPRTQVVKQLWVYIREHGLQDPGDKRKIICDDALRNLLGTNSTDMFKMNKLLSKHIWPLENGGAAGATSRDRDTDTEDAEPKPKRQKTVRSGDAKGKNVGFLAPCPISEQLAGFLEVDDGKISRADAVRRMWDYIKENNLQDPSNKKMILCDAKLQDLFECERFIGFGLTKLLTRHFLKTEAQEPFRIS